MAAPRKKTTVKKPVSGTMGERLGEAKNRPYKGTKGGAVTKVTKPRATGRQYSGDTIKMKGPQQGVTKPKVVPLGDRPKLLSGPKTGTAKAAIGVAARNAAVRAVGVGAIFDPSFMSYKTGGAAGEGSDKTPKYGRSLRAEAEARKKAAFGTGGGNPKTVNPYRKPKDTVGNNPNRGIGTSKASLSGMTGKGRLRPEVKKKKSAIEEAYTLGNGAQGKAPPNTSTSAQTSNASTSAAAPKQPKGMTFQQAVRRNRTEEYTRAKMKPKGSLLGLLRKRKG